MRFNIRVPDGFNFWRTVYSHGWCALPPFEIDKKNDCLIRVLDFASEKKVVAKISYLKKQTLNIFSSENLSKIEREEAVTQLRSCFRLDEDYSEFYTEANKNADFKWVPKAGAGRLLRAPTVFEDVVKMICTTNCSWALTEIMVDNLCKKLGFKLDDSYFTFPTPEVIAGFTEKYLRKEIRAGYRAPYILELSRRITKGNIDIEKWQTSGLSTEELFKKVRSVKGIGPYAAGNILKLLGRYDYLGIDSWCRGKFFEIHRNGKKCSDKVIENHYKHFGKWRGLFFWMDVTKDWYAKKFPF
ncbi:MAG: DNA-3-methyladenine glycosylase 2 family protein [Ignavibacteriales bacterium]|nr:DNA-3-methyladenine glycosylase 2 family protein [Ignavibacteriales bacterium]